MNASPLVVGLISDTHGLLRDEALAALAGSDAIIHAGDIGDAMILARLESLAPVTAVRGNNDRDAWARHLPETATMTFGGVRMLVIHDVNALSPVPDGVDVVVSGHSHRPRCERRGGLLYVNPGSAGPRRFRLPIAVAKLAIAARDVDFELVTLDVPGSQADARPAAFRR